MEIRFRKKSELNSGASATSASNPASNSTAEPKQERESIFVKMTAKLRWERENIEPDLGELYPYYKHYCYIFLTVMRSMWDKVMGIIGTIAWKNMIKLVGVWLKCGQTKKKQKKGK
jgi:hypothetical protein